MSLNRKVAYNTGVQIIGRVIGLLVMLITINYIANHLLVGGSAQVGYGYYTIVFTYVSIIGVIADFGLFSLMVRDISGQSREKATQVMSSALGFRLVLFVVTMLILGGLYVALPYDPVVRMGILIGGFIAFSLLFTQTIAALLQAHLATDKIVLAEIIGRVVLMLGVVWALRSGYGLMAVVTIHLIGYTVTLLATYLYARRYASLSFRFDLGHWRSMLPQFIPIAAVTLLSVVHFKIDSLILSFYRPAAEVGIYGIAYKLFEIAIIVSSIFATNLLPLMTRFHRNGEGVHFERITRRGASLLLAIGGLVTLLLFVYAPWVIVYVSQIEFVSAVLPLRILILSLMSVYIADLVLQTMIATGNQKRLIWAYVIAIPLNIILNLYAIPHYSYIGAAVTTIITEIILVGCMVFTARKAISFRFEWTTVFRVAVALLVTAAIVSVARNWFIVSLEEFLGQSKLEQTGRLFGAVIPVVVVFGAGLWLVYGGSIRKLRQLIQLHEGAS